MIEMGDGGLGVSDGGDVKLEAEPKDLNLGVSVQNLYKVYKNGTTAVENLSVNFYEDQITSFLGEDCHSSPIYDECRTQSSRF